MKIKMRLRLNTYIALGVFILIMISLVWSFREMSRATQNVDLVAEMRKVALERATLRDDYLLYQEERARTQWVARFETLRGMFESASKIFTDNEDQALLKEARKDFDYTFMLFSQLINENKGKEGSYKKGINNAEADRAGISQCLFPERQYQQIMTCMPTAT